MPTQASEVLTLVDYAKRLDPSTNSVSTEIAELLSQTNAILDDMLWKESNQATGHTLVMRNGLPSGIWRKYNQGVPNSKSTTVQVTESMGMLFQRGKVDKDIAALNGNTASFRLSENLPHMEAMAQDMATTLLYGDHTANPEQFLGLAPRYSTISGAVNGQNILDAGGTGDDNTSIWLVGWGDKSCYGLFPKGSKSGLQHLAITDSSGDGCVDTQDEDGRSFRAFVDEYSWKAGFALKDWRYIVRICNIDVSNLVAESSAADLIKLLSRAMDRIPTYAGIRPVFYANRTVYSMLKIQALNKSASALAFEKALDQLGREIGTLKFLGIPCRLVDQITNSESRIV